MDHRDHVMPASSASAQASAIVQAPIAAAPPPDAKNADFLFEMIVADLQWTSIQIAAVCMMATACAPLKSPWSLRSCRHLLYDDTGVMRLALRYGAEVGLPDPLPRTLDRLYAELSEIQKRVSPLAETTALGATQREQVQRLVPQLRRVASAASLELEKIEPIARGRLDASYLEDSVAIRQFLGKAVQGDTTAVDRYGVVNTPRLKQRRHSPRVPLEKPCLIVTSVGEFDARLINVSREGLGLVAAAPLAVGQKVIVVVEGDRRLEAKVVRHTGQQVGLTLSQNLPFTDPLFMAE